MEFKSSLFIIFISSFIHEKVYSLTCLSCNSILQPRHCHEVTVCDTDEVCGAERLPSSMGFQTYQLGCVSKSTCTNGTSMTGVQCKQCCYGDLCNAALCGEPDYPNTRGPICYACKYHTDKQSCRRIQFCSENEECGILAVDEFGDTVLTSGCKQKHSCDIPNAGPDVFVGKRFISSSTNRPTPPVIVLSTSIAGTISSLHPSTPPKLQTFPPPSSSLPPKSTFSTHVSQHASTSHIIHATPFSFSPTRFTLPGIPPTLSVSTLPGIPPTLSTQTVKSTPPLSTSTLAALTKISFRTSSPSATTTSSIYICNKCCTQDLCNLNCSTTNLCATSSCKHGTCVMVNSTATCVCSSGWFGTRCDIFDRCSANPCMHGKCTKTPTSYSCACQFGWSGHNCDVSVLTAYNCDFESGTCSWTQSRADNFDWTRHSGPTGSTGTGPSVDHTYGTSSGYYMYIEASDVSTGTKADLVSQLIPPGPPGQEYCFSLAVNMYGSTMGSIDIYLQPERKTQFQIQHFKQITNDQTWYVHNLTIPAQSRNFSIIIEGVRGTNYYSDAAIDDLILRPGSC